MNPPLFKLTMLNKDWISHSLSERSETFYLDRWILLRGLHRLITFLDLSIQVQSDGDSNDSDEYINHNPAL